MSSTVGPGSGPPTAPGTPKRHSVSGTTAGFEAYRAEPVVAGFGRRIESLCWWQDTVLAGLQDGSLLFFKQVDVAGAPAAGVDAAGSGGDGAAAASPGKEGGKQWQVRRAAAALRSVVCVCVHAAWVWVWVWVDCGLGCPRGGPGVGVRCPWGWGCGSAEPEAQVRRQDGEPVAEQCPRRGEGEVNRRRVA